MMIPRSWAFNFVAFVAFEYLITFDQEVNFFWKRKITGATILFFFNRYIVLLLYVMNISGSGSLSKSVEVSLSACNTFPIGSSLTVLHLQGYVFDSDVSLKHNEKKPLPSDVRCTDKRASRWA